MADVAGDDLLLLEGLRDSERVVDHRLLDWVHLGDEQTDFRIEVVPIKRTQQNKEKLKKMSPPKGMSVNVIVRTYGEIFIFFRQNSPEKNSKKQAKKQAAFPVKSS